MNNQPAVCAGKFADVVDDKRIADSFAIALMSGGRAENTVKTYLKAIDYLSAFAHEKGMPPVAGLTGEHLREYFTSLYKRGLQASSVSVQYRALAVFYGFLVKDGERQDNPLTRVDKPKVGEKIQHHYTPSDCWGCYQAERRKRREAGGGEVLRQDWSEMWAQACRDYKKAKTAFQKDRCLRTKKEIWEKRLRAAPSEAPSEAYTVTCECGREVEMTVGSCKHSPTLFAILRDLRAATE